MSHTRAFTFTSRGRQAKESPDDEQIEEADLDVLLATLGILQTPAEPVRAGRVFGQADTGAELPGQLSTCPRVPSDDTAN